jgi:hypothetical protein
VGDELLDALLKLTRQEVVVEQDEPPRDCRRPVGVSYAAIV